MSRLPYHCQHLQLSDPVMLLMLRESAAGIGDWVTAMLHLLFQDGSQTFPTGIGIQLN